MTYTTNKGIPGVSPRTFLEKRVFFKVGSTVYAYYSSMPEDV
jgi:hypothetical protein